MKKIIRIIGLLGVFALLAFNLTIEFSEENNSVDFSLEMLQSANAQDSEDPGYTGTCSSGSSGQCYSAYPNPETAVYFACGLDLLTIVVVNQK